VAESEKYDSSVYLRYLPRIFQDKESSLDLFLLGFQDLLSERVKVLEAPVTPAPVYIFWGETLDHSGLLLHMRDAMVTGGVPRRDADRVGRFSSYLKDYFEKKKSPEDLAGYLKLYFDEITGAILPGFQYDDFVYTFGRLLLCYYRELIPEEKVIDQMEGYYNSYTTPAQFLDWLASWLGLKLNHGDDYNHEMDMIEWDYLEGQIVPLENGRESYNRKLLANIFNLYRHRGTRTGLYKYLNFYRKNISYLVTSDNNSGEQRVYIRDIFRFEIYEYLYPAIVKNIDSDIVEPWYEGLRIGETTVVHEKNPHYFRIKVMIDRHNETPAEGYEYCLDYCNNIELIKKIKADVIAIVDSQKPAHSYYAMTFHLRDMKIDDPELIVGYNTFIGGRYRAN